MHPQQAISGANQGPVGPAGEGIAIQATQMGAALNPPGVNEQVLQPRGQDAALRRSGEEIGLDGAPELLADEEQIRFALTLALGGLMFGQRKMPGPHGGNADQQTEQGAAVLSASRTREVTRAGVQGDPGRLTDAALCTSNTRPVALPRGATVTQSVCSVIGSTGTLRRYRVLTNSSRESG